MTSASRVGPRAYQRFPAARGRLGQGHRDERSRSAAERLGTHARDAHLRRGAGARERRPVGREGRGARAAPGHAPVEYPARAAGGDADRCRHACLSGGTVDSSHPLTRAAAGGPRYAFLITLAALVPNGLALLAARRGYPRDVATAAASDRLSLERGEPPSDARMPVPCRTGGSPPSRTSPARDLSRPTARA